MKLADLRVEDLAVIDESTAVVVGTKDGPEDADPDKLGPNGAIIDLTRGTSRPFTNGHTARICSVSAARGRVATASNNRDPVLRVWDLGANRTVAAVEIEKPGDRVTHYGAAWFHESDRVAVAADTRVVVFDPARPGDRAEFACPPGSARWVEKPAVGPGDAWLACPADRATVVFWEVATRKATAVSLLPKGADPDGSGWSVDAVRFGPKGELFACRSSGSEDEVPENTAEKDVPADRRGVVRIDLPAGRVVPLGMGQTVYTLSCAADPTGTWLVTGGTSRLDRPGPDAKTGGELRVYRMPYGELVHREQPKDSLPLKWVSFTPGGKRVVAATHDGVVRWWDAQAP
jgi:WD40 repeat protein